MQENLDRFYLSKEEPIKSCLIALRDIILSYDGQIVNSWKYGMPFFCYNNKMICYLWIHRKFGKPYLGIVEGKYFDEHYLLSENRSRMKILLIDPNEDLPMVIIKNILKKLLKF
ncbi:MAG: DUF1801 domain-containing protein [Saprospiraceae bacterium]|nr:DUF1801 domain-containing protein [Saprospiraceae bacterium]